MWLSSRSSASRTSSSSTASSASRRSSSSSETGSSFSVPPPSCQPATPNSADGLQRPRGARGLLLVRGVEDERTLRQDERRLRREARARDRDADGAGWWPAANTSVGRTSRTIASSGTESIRSSGGWAPRSSPRFSSTIRSMFGGRGGCGPSRAGEEVGELALERRVEAALEADGRRRLRAHRGTAERARDVAGEDLDAVTELDEAAQAVEEALGSLLRLDREIRRAGIADEERVAGEDEPRLVAAGAVDHREAAVLGSVTRRVDRPQDDLADLDLRPVVERLVRERRAGVAVDADRDAVLERETSVAGDVVGVRVRLEDADEPDVAALRLRQHAARRGTAGRRRPRRRRARRRRGSRRSPDRRSGTA